MVLQPMTMKCMYNFIKRYETRILDIRCIDCSFCCMNFELFRLAHNPGLQKSAKIICWFLFLLIVFKINIFLLILSSRNQQINISILIFQHQQINKKIFFNKSILILQPWLKLPFCLRLLQIVDPKSFHFHWVKPGSRRFYWF